MEIKKGANNELDTSEGYMHLGQCVLGSDLQEVILGFLRALPISHPLLQRQKLCHGSLFSCLLPNRD